MPSRPCTLFTGQWADLPLETLAEMTASWGYDGLELACWGDHFDVQKALSEPGYCQSRLDLLARHGLRCWAISNHLVGQAVCDRIDHRHQSILPDRVWGDGEPEGVRKYQGRKRTGIGVQRRARSGDERRHVLRRRRDHLAEEPVMIEKCGRRGRIRGRKPNVRGAGQV